MTSKSPGPESRKNRSGVLRQAFSLTRPYFQSEEKWKAWGLLAAIVGISAMAIVLIEAAS